MLDPYFGHQVPQFHSCIFGVASWGWFLHIFHSVSCCVMLAASAARAESLLSSCSHSVSDDLQISFQQKPSRDESVYEAHKFGSTGYLFCLSHCLFCFEFRTVLGFERLPSRLKSIGCFFLRQMSRTHDTRLIQIDIHANLGLFVT